MYTFDVLWLQCNVVRNYNMDILSSLLNNDFIEKKCKQNLQTV